MINLFKNKKEDVKTNQYHSISFRVNSEDKANLLEQANELNISLSEFVRNKALFDDIELQKLFDENIELKQQNKEYENKIDVKKSKEVDTGSIHIQLTGEGKEILSKVLSELRWNRFDHVKRVIENDHQLAVAIGFILVEHIVEPLGEMEELREEYKLLKIEELFERILIYYMDV